MHVELSQAFGLSGSPETPHAPIGHSVVVPGVVHAAPLLVPPWHRRPPHTIPAPQSALVEQGAEPGCAQVSQKHFDPGAVRQAGLSALRVLVTPPVVLASVIGNAPICAPGSGGQSKLVLPWGSNVGLVPATSHGEPLRGPPTQVPVRWPSPGVLSPLQIGHGWLSNEPRDTRDRRCVVFVLSPLSMFAVPVTLPTTWFVTHVETPPAASGSGGPKKNWQVPGAVQSALLVHAVDVSFEQRWLFEIPWLVSGFAIGPVRLQTPHGRALPPQSVETVTSPPLMILEMCASPVQPVSSDVVFASPRKEIAPGHAEPPDVGVAVGPVAVGPVGVGPVGDTAGVGVTPPVVTADVGVAVFTALVGVRSIGVGLPPPLSLLLPSPQCAIRVAIMRRPTTRPPLQSIWYIFPPWMPVDIIFMVMFSRSAAASC